MTSNLHTCRIDGCTRKPAYGASVCTHHTSHGRRSDPAKRYQPATETTKAEMRKVIYKKS